MKMKKKTKRILRNVVLFVLAIGVTATIGYFSSGFSKWTAEDWRGRLTERVDDENNDETPEPSDETPASSEEA